MATAVLIGVVPPNMVKTAANPGGIPKEQFDGLQVQAAANRAQLYLDFPSGPSFSQTDFTTDLDDITVPTLVMHGLPTTHAETINTDLLAFIRS
jgi:non-heme chloroperoxidase